MGRLQTRYICQLTTDLNKGCTRGRNLYSDWSKTSDMKHCSETVMCNKCCYAPNIGCVLELQLLHRGG